ncbi:unnamed protein product [Phyllotreta striolata]|uniref:Uncharacterized protein n=1 Tax=Phyllotreta striolata TaxID=444603 RepID=A0A9N9XQK3_PHYSR|nr:unnamed protein product [Phyllotreta striolata]
MKFSAVLCLAIVLCVAVSQSSARPDKRRAVAQTLELRLPNRHQRPVGQHLTKDIRLDDLPSVQMSHFFHEHDDLWKTNYPQYAKFERKNEADSGVWKPSGGSSSNGIYEV